MLVFPSFRQTLLSRLTVKDSDYDVKHCGLAIYASCIRSWRSALNALHCADTHRKNAKLAAILGQS
jgi:hypothetical protein